MGIGIFNKIKRIGKGFLKDILNNNVVKGPKDPGALLHEAVNEVKNAIVNNTKNVIKKDILDKNKLLRSLNDNLRLFESDQGPVDEVKPLVSYASRNWIPKFKD